MIAQLGNLLALVAQGHMNKGEARALAAHKWCTGVVPVEELAGFDAELIKLWEEQRTAGYVDRVATRSWGEIEDLLRSPHLDFATKQEIRNHPDVKAKRQAFKWAAFGASGSTREAIKRLVFTGPATSEELEGARKSWLDAWPEVKRWLGVLDPLPCDGLGVQAETYAELGKAADWARELAKTIDFSPWPFVKAKKRPARRRASRSGKSPKARAPKAGSRKATNRIRRAADPKRRG